MPAPPKVPGGSSPSTRWTSPTPTRRRSCTEQACAHESVRRDDGQARRSMSRFPPDRRQSRPRLLENIILLQSACSDLRADPRRIADGVVIEAKLDRGRGPVAAMLVQGGTLHPGDIIVAGSEWGRVRALVDDHGQTVSEAPPSMPVEVLGFQGAPEAGDRFAVVESRGAGPRDRPTTVPARSARIRSPARLRRAARWPR